MLVLSRKIGEQIVIGNGIVLVVKRIAGGRVTVGIQAPGDVRIIRGELGVLEPYKGEKKNRELRGESENGASIKPR